MSNYFRTVDRSISANRSRVAAVVMVLLIGCSAATRDRLESFFFEVPPPPPPPAASAEPKAASTELAAVSLPESRYVSVHQPYEAKQCDACHEVEKQMKVRENVADACKDCHDEFFGPKVGHAPVSQGQCVQCHDPHRSLQPHLLKLPLLQTCADCHDETSKLSAPAHSGSNAAQCTACHDPHFGTGHLLRPDAQAPSK